MKYPQDRRPLIELSRIFNKAYDMARNLHHDELLLIYVSSFMLSNSIRLSIRGRRHLRLDEVFRNLVQNYQNIIIIVRTQAPEHFPSRNNSNYRRVQEQAIQSLREYCIVATYRIQTRRNQPCTHIFGTHIFGEFINHAKFIIIFHIRRNYFGYIAFYGSTNLTAAGLSDRTMGGIPGNYEEYVITQRKSVRLSSSRARYVNVLRDALNLLNQAYLMNNIPDALRDRVETFLKYLKAESRIDPPISSIEIHAITYLRLLSLLHESIAFLNILPGQSLVKNILDEIARYVDDVGTIFDLEVLRAFTEEDLLRVLELIGLSIYEIERRISLLKHILEKIIIFLRDKYIPTIDKIRMYYEPWEERLLRILKEKERTLKIAFEIYKMLE